MFLMSFFWLLLVCHMYSVGSLAATAKCVLECMLPTPHISHAHTRPHTQHIFILLCN